MRFFIKRNTLVAFALLVGFQSMAEKNILKPGKTSQKKSFKISASCSPATSQVELDVNNVRTTLLAGGDMWWDLSSAKYEIPKIQPGSGQPSVHSLFAGALWIGGIDAGGQLKIAAQTYRQSGNDFWPGPLDNNSSVDDKICSDYDRHWKVELADIETMVQLGVVYSVDQGGTIPLGNIPNAVLEWPGKGNPSAVGANGVPLNLSPNKPMAPFVDVNADNIYNPENGDYPDVPGDQAIWWVYNDKGNIHSETGGEAIGLEIQSLAFAFATNDEINDMTFYKYQVRNFSTTTLDSVYFGQWVDADLGYAFDDFVGACPDNSLGICYNGDAVDGPASQAYGTNPPMVGVDFFKGPKKYIYSGNQIIDSVTLGMSKYLYYNNDFSQTGNPEVASHYYGYLSGTWKDGSPFTFGGNGFHTGAATDIMFPDAPGGGGWSECDEGNTPGDRRFMQSSGPFRLEPGANNEVVVGVVWVRPNTQTGCNANFSLICGVDEKAQALFDNNFKLIDGPDAPTMTIRELDRELIISVYNDSSVSNNAGEDYEQTDPIIKSIINALPDSLTNGDSTYNFQGYKIYQLKNDQISSSEFSDPNKARLVAQVDLKDNVAKLVNLSFDSNLGADVPELMVNGNNAGILHSFKITEDAFAPGDKTLINHKSYYFSVIAYAENNYMPYQAGNPDSQKKPYLEGRKNIKSYSGIPHIPDPENEGMILNSAYGDGPEITRIEGSGNGGNIVDISPETIDEILTNGSAQHPVYQRGMGPVLVKVYDPVKVPNGDFELTFTDPTGSSSILDSSTTWTLKNNLTGDVWTSDMSIRRVNEQLIPEIGLSVTIQQTNNPGDGNGVDANGLLESSIEYADPGQVYLSAVPDGEQQSMFNWIRSGTYTNPNGSDFNDYADRDNNELYENVVNGTWAPMALLGGIQAGEDYMPGRGVPGLLASLRIDSISSVDLVLTPDKSKWTHCIVVEQNDDPALSEGGRRKMELRDHASWNKDGTYDASDRGRSWFPGYAINVETGNRLNIIFGEDSWLAADNGNDMIWNPTDNLFTAAGPNGFDLRFGGKHYIYISNQRYDEGVEFQQQYQTNSVNVSTRNVFKTCIWVSPAMLATESSLASLSDGLIPTITKIRLRVQKPYVKKVINGENGGYPKYGFSTDSLAVEIQNTEVATNALDLIRVVPNPYYAYSSYERSQLDNRVKITNLPRNCAVSIYTIDGQLVRKFDRNANMDNTPGEKLGTTNPETSIDWDLKNHKNIPIASGLYLIHVSAPGLGERVVKWFGVMRPIDLDTF